MPTIAQIKTWEEFNQNNQAVERQVVQEFKRNIPKHQILQRLRKHICRRDLRKYIFIFLYWRINVSVLEYNWMLRKLQDTDINQMFPFSWIWEFFAAVEKYKCFSTAYLCMFRFMHQQQNGCSINILNIAPQAPKIWRNLLFMFRWISSCGMLRW